MSENTTIVAEPKRRKLDASSGASWAFQDGLLRLQLWPEKCSDHYTIWMTPGQALELIEQGSRVTRLCLKASL